MNALWSSTSLWTRFAVSQVKSECQTSVEIESYLEDVALDRFLEASARWNHIRLHWKIHVISINYNHTM